jgi:hypothetical protein
MTLENSVNQNIENKPSDKELNFRALERRTQEAERRAQEAERALQERSQLSHQDDDDDSEPYVDHKKLQKTLNKFGDIYKNMVVLTSNNLKSDTRS